MGREREKYIDTGFDGWILKPVNFQRVDTLLKGIVEEEVREACLFEPGQWERRGWFEKRQATSDVFANDNTPSDDAPITVSLRPPASLTKVETL